MEDGRGKKEEGSDGRCKREEGRDFLNSADSPLFLIITTHILVQLLAPCYQYLY